MKAGLACGRKQVWKGDDGGNGKKMGGKWEENGRSEGTKVWSSIYQQTCPRQDPVPTDLNSNVQIPFRPLYEDFSANLQPVIHMIYMQFHS